jgi:hypothetical protein
LVVVMRAAPLFVKAIWLVLLAGGGVARSLQIAADMRLTSTWPAAKIPAPQLRRLFLRGA